MPSKYDTFLVVLKDFEFFYDDFWTVFKKEI